MNAASNPFTGSDQQPYHLRERETATREILQVISRSRDDYAPVFDAILRNAASLCNAPLAGIYIANDARTHLTLTANWGDPLKSFVPGETIWPLDSGVSIAVAARERRTVQVADLRDTDLYRQRDPIRVRAVEEEGIRTFLAVPLIGGPDVIGCIGLYRREVKPFSAADISIVESFAAQAVIAIENVRQFRTIQAANAELQIRLEREAATREILEVVSQSRDDERPVFEVILRNASRLCRAPLAFLPMANEARTHVTVPAFLGVRPEFGAVLAEFHEPMQNSQLVAVRAVSEARVICSPDLVNDPQFPASGRWRTELAQTEGARSVLVVPLMRAAQAIGAIMLYRREVSPFSDSDVALVESFAAQAVIAVDNVRQNKALEASTAEVQAQAAELQALNASLEQRVEEQVSEIERMGRLKRFLSPQVADAVVSSGEDMLSSHRALIAVLFCDIRGFTSFCETAEPEETIDVLQTYHEEMGRLLQAHGAGVDHRSGDGIMVIFNDPLPCDDPAGDAVRLALAMQARMQELCQGWRRLGHRLGFGVGISLGYATVGMVGSEGRYDYTASGTAVNLGARLCDQAKDGEILLSQRAATAVEGEHATEAVGAADLKGIREPVEIFRLVLPAR